MRPAKQFEGMILAPFTAKVQPSLDVRAETKKLDDLMTARIGLRGKTGVTRKRTAAAKA